MADESDKAAPAKLAATITDTKTSLDGVHVLWSEGDALAVVSNTDFSRTQYTIETGVGENTGVFSGDAKEGTQFLAVSPYSRTSIDEHYLYVTIPLSQNYVPNGIDNGLLPMYAVGESTDALSFNHLGSIIQVRLYASKETQINGVSFFFNGVVIPPASLQFTNELVLQRSGSSSSSQNVKITLNCNNIALGTTKETATVFNIVVMGGTMATSGFDVSITADTGETMSLSKTEPFVLEYGKIHRFSAVEFKDNYASCQKQVKLDEGKWEALATCEGVAKDSVCVKTLSGHQLNADDLDLIKTILNRSASPVKLDMKRSEFNSGTLPVFVSKKVSEMVLPRNITTLPDNAFNGCTNLSSIDLDGVTTIKTYAFDNCAFTTIYIPASVESISNNWISLHGSHVTSFVVSEENPYFKSVDGVLFNKAGTRLKEYPRARTSSSYEIPDGVQYIQGYAFFLANSLQELTFPESILSVPSANTLSGSVKTITMKKSTPFDVKWNPNNIPNGGTLKVPVSCGEAYLSAWSWLTTKKWTVVDGTTPENANGTIGPLGEEDVPDNGYWD